MKCRGYAATLGSDVGVFSQPAQLDQESSEERWCQAGRIPGLDDSSGVGGLVSAVRLPVSSLARAVQESEPD